MQNDIAVSNRSSARSTPLSTVSNSSRRSRRSPSYEKRQITRAMSRLSIKRGSIVSDSHSLQPLLERVQQSIEVKKLEGIQLRIGPSVRTCTNSIFIELFPTTEVDTSDDESVHQQDVRTEGMAMHGFHENILPSHETSVDTAPVADSMKKISTGLESEESETESLTPSVTIPCSVSLERLSVPTNRQPSNNLKSHRSIRKKWRRKRYPRKNFRRHFRFGDDWWSDDTTQEVQLEFVIKQEPDD